MLKANVEFDNYTASSLSPLDYIEKYVFNENFKFISYNEKKKESIYKLYGALKTEIITIKLKNLRQI